MSSRTGNWITTFDDKELPETQNSVSKILLTNVFGCSLLSPVRTLSPVSDCRMATGAQCAMSGSSECEDGQTTAREGQAKARVQFSLIIARGSIAGLQVSYTMALPCLEQKLLLHRVILRLSEC